MSAQTRQQANTYHWGKLAGSDKEPTIKDFDDLEALACGEMSLTISYLYSLTARQFDNILRGYVKKQEDGIKVQMTLARELEFAVISPYLDKKDRHLTPQKYKPFSWEQPEERKIKKRMTAKEHQEIWKKFDQQKNSKV